MQSFTSLIVESLNSDADILNLPICALVDKHLPSSIDYIVIINKNEDFYK